MKKLKKILQCKAIYYVLLIISIGHAVYISNQEINSKYKKSDNTFIGIIKSLSVKDKVLNISIKGKENLRGTFLIKENNIDYTIGDKVKIVGKLKVPSNNTVPNLFNYKNYMKSKGEKWLIEINKINKIGESKNIIDIIKKVGYKKINSYKSKSYLKLFLFGDKQDVDSNVIKSYQANGISHLFSISGMHLSFLSIIFIFILKKVTNSDTMSIVLTSILLILYMLLVGATASVSRATVFFIIKNLYKKLKIEIPIIYIYYLMIFIILIFKPGFILDIGFQYSAIICFFLLYSYSKENNNNYFLGLLKVSILSFLVSIPITLYNFYEINILGIIYNLFFVPMVSIFIFPLSFITLIFPLFDSILYYLTYYMENISLLLSHINCGKLIFIKPSLWWIIIYYFTFILFYKSSKKRYILMVIILLLFLYFFPIIFPSRRVTFIDVGQGDSYLLELNGNNILIDTGGKMNKNNSNKISENILLPLLKSKGIRKLDYLILTHGDFDHMGEAINLVNNFKVNKVVLNCGTYNNIEKDLISVLNKNKITYYSCIKELNVNNYRLQFLNTKKYDNENDNSNVIYLNYNNFNFLFMGDAGIIKERDILNKFYLRNIEFLKVGHHGSNTSSSKNFIDIINPKYSIISVGKNNRYGHPKDSVLNNLKNSNIYRTDKDGSIEIKLNKSGYKIKTYSP